ncbi:MAG TPA: hypothetical protein VF665_11230 [Longimicrobium sp.]|jgi:hypothetical protein|uniref:hypothetical protein n=1 Tax=Longimicrobium sp. TaxID=2029185 RepID=UPI002ED7A4FF
MSSNHDDEPRPVPGEYTTIPGYGTMRLRETSIPFGVYALDEPVARRSAPDYKAEVRDNLSRVCVIRTRMHEDQCEIDRLRGETRQILDSLRAA